MYMHSEWKDRLRHWITTLQKDFYEPLGPIEVEAFCTMDQIPPAEAAKGSFAPMAPGTPWGNTWEYCWSPANASWTMDKLVPVWKGLIETE